MKKILLTLAVVLMALPLSAQLKTTGKNSFKTLGTVRMGVVLVTQGDAGIAMGVNTNNRFDNPGFFFLGGDKESALQTVKDLIDVLENGEEGDMITVECAPGHKCDLIPKKQLGIKTLFFYFDDCAGYQNMTRQELEKISSIREEKAK